jgi:D-arabinose 1-dehydrogenase-like Zn-dependent alcohol dehydrogenase
VWTLWWKSENPERSPNRSAYRIGGRIALMGVLTGIAGEVPTAALMGRQQRLNGVTVGSRRNQQDLVRAPEATGIKPSTQHSHVRQE